MENYQLNYPDHTHSIIRVFKSSQPTAPTFLVLPAMGTKARYYEPFAAKLSMENYHVIIADWRGNGDFSIQPSREVNFGYEELIEDIGTLVDYADEVFPNSKKMIVGHSLGGQVGSLYTAIHPERIAGLVLMTSCLVHYRGWGMFGGLKVLFASTLFPILSTVLGYFPGHQLGFAGKEAKQVMKDWSYNGWTGKYATTNNKVDYNQALAQLSKKILSISVEGDVLASKQAVINLLNKYHSSSNITHLHVSSEESGVRGLNHFKWVKQPDYFVDLIAKWERRIN